MTDPENHSAAEDLDEDRLKLDPLEEGMDPPEHWSQAMEEHDSLDERLAEEEPDRPRRGQEADEASVARELRTPRT
jgi:hypothetical protein